MKRYRSLRILEAANGWVVETEVGYEHHKRLVARDAPGLLQLVEEWIWQGGDFDDQGGVQCPSS